MLAWLGRPNAGPVYETMDDYGGGGGSSGQQFFYLVVKGTDTGRLSSSDVKSFFRSVVNTTSDYIFAFIDISSNHRSHTDLVRHPGGEVV